MKCHPKSYETSTDKNVISSRLKQAIQSECTQIASVIASHVSRQKPEWSVKEAGVLRLIVTYDHDLEKKPHPPAPGLHTVWDLS